ncbi:hypothetical protein VTK73DRAFT_862 [Phialemonium thermophilum]|uniref:Uncharacterized protein n=1 Tax=Phialemonium thermophilum TaxID=223376 RepID=A0ABR3VU71_9PEZI
MAAAAPTSDIIFIVGNDPSKIKASATLPKSHVARHGWKSHSVARTRVRRRKQPQPLVRVAYEWTDVTSCKANQEEGEKEGTVVVVRPPPLPPIEFQLGGGRTDPFRTYPGRWRPDIPVLVDHYLQHMALPIQELDQSDTGLLRSRWFPLTMTEPATFYSILLLSAANRAALQHHTGAACTVLQLKADAIAYINRALGDRSMQTSDAVIGAVAKMGSYEAMQGDPASYLMHMRAVQAMVAQRGGLSRLGLGGLLRRIIVWIDINSSFLLDTPRFFPNEEFAETDGAVILNLERFIAA